MNQVTDSLGIRAPTSSNPTAAASKAWLWGGYAFIAFFFVTRLLYIGSGTIGLTEDEAYQWLWSKHLALSYFSKPPLIAFVQFAGTALFGDTEFGVRFFSPVLAALLSVWVLRFMASVSSPRVGFWLIVMLAATPLTALGATLLTVDSLSVFFWVGAMLAGWRALNNGATGNWALAGLCLGFGFLSKYTALFQLLGFVLFFLLWAPARAQLRRPGPYIAVGIFIISLVPVIWWNWQHGWITATHLSQRGGLDQPWRLQSRYLVEFLGSLLALLNPVFFVAAAWAVLASWRRSRAQPLTLYLLAMGLPVFGFYLLYTLRGRVLPNWIAPAVIPLFLVMVLYWNNRLEAGASAVKRWLTTGLTVGFASVVFMHATELVKPLTGHFLPAKIDPLHQVRGWKEIASLLEKRRQQVLQEGPPVFFILDHYGTTSELTFYNPAAKEHLATDPLVYYVRSSVPQNQFFFWPGYSARKGQNALYVIENDEQPRRLRPSLLEDFHSVTYLGKEDAFYFGRPFRRFQLYLCRDLR